MRRLILHVLALALAGAPVAHAQLRPDQRRAELNTLLDALRTASSERYAAVLETRIRQLWLEQGSPAVVLMINRGQRDLGNEAAAAALSDFNTAITLAPDLPDAYFGRALARYAGGDYHGALADIEQTLKLEPRHFPAFEALSRIAEALHDDKGALAAWQKALDLSPKTPGGAERLKALTLKVQGEST